MASPKRSNLAARIAIWATLAALVLGAAYLASSPGSGTAAANGPGTAPEFAAIERFVQKEMAAQRIPGLALGIVRDGRIAYLRGFGRADESGRAVTPKTPFIIGSLSKSFTALAIMRLVEAGKVELDAPVQRYLPWFRVADEKASGEITVRHLLNHTSGLSTKTGRSYQGNGDTSDAALEKAVRRLSSVELTAPVGEKFQYSTINYSVLGLIVQTVTRRSYESYVQTEILDPLEMRDSFTSDVAAKKRGLATGHNYWFGRPRAADLPYNRGLVPAGYLISSAEDMTHYLIAQLNGGRFRSASVLSPAGVDELHRPAVPTPERSTSYGMGWFVGPINRIPAIHHQGETFNFHANAVLVPGSRTGVIVLINAENSLDLFLAGRMGTISEGVTSLLEGREPSPPPSSIATFLVYAMLFGAIVLQLRGMTRSVVALRRRRLPGGRLGPRWHIALSLALNLTWALLVLVLLPKQFGLSLTVMAQGLPDLAYLLLASGLAALGWGVVRTAWAYFVLRRLRRDEAAARVAPTSGLIQQHPLASFFVLAYAISWLLWLPLVVSGDGSPTGLGFVLLLLGSLVPSAVAILLVAVLQGTVGVRTLLRRLFIWRVGAGWWGAVVLLSTLGLVAVGLSILLGGDSPDLGVTIPGVVVLFVFSIFPGSAGGEEIGWRGFALPHLQADRSALGASVVLGVAWGVWHLPLYLIGSDIRPLALFAPWVILTVAVSIILTWMYNGTGGSLLIVVLFHAASNLPLTVLFEPLEGEIAKPFLIYVALWILAASVVVAAAGPATLSRTRAKQVAARLDHGETAGRVEPPATPPLIEPAA